MGGWLVGLALDRMGLHVMGYLALARQGLHLNARIWLGTALWGCAAPVRNDLFARLGVLRPAMHCHAGGVLSKETEPLHPNLRVFCGLDEAQAATGKT